MKLRLIRNVSLAVLAAFLLLSACSGKKQEVSSQQTAIIKYGVLPVIQALPLFVAREKGYFREAGLQVELVNFNSALEKDVAITSGQIDGYFGDIMTPMVLLANGTPVRMVATIFKTTGKQRMFAVLEAPNLPVKSALEISREGVAGSSNTIIEYITQKSLQQVDTAVTSVNMIETKNIPIRLQMLLSSQVPAAALPEPLASLAEMKGARAIADDAGKGISSTVLVFRSPFLQQSPQKVRFFLGAVARAVSYINANPREVRPIMNQNCRVPEPLKENFAIPLFPALSQPDSSEVMDVYNWLHRKQIVKTDLTYSQMVDDEWIR